MLIADFWTLLKGSLHSSIVQTMPAGGATSAVAAAEWLHEKTAALRASRPTAVNLFEVSCAWHAHRHGAFALTGTRAFLLHRRWIASTQWPPKHQDHLQRTLTKLSSSLYLLQRACLWCVRAAFGHQGAHCSLALPFVLFFLCAWLHAAG